MTPRIPLVLSTIFLNLVLLGASAAWAAPCAPLLEPAARFDAVVTASSGRLLSRGPLTVTDIRPTSGAETVFTAAYTPEGAAPVQLTGMARGDEISMLVDEGSLPEATARPAWLGVCSETGMTGRIGGDQGFELLPTAVPEGTMTTEGEPMEVNATEDEDYWPAASEAPIILPEPEDLLPPDSNASGLEAVEDLPPLPQPETAGEVDPVAEALRELAMETQGAQAPPPTPDTGYAIGNETASATEPEAGGVDIEESASTAAIDMSEADCRYLPRSVFGDEFPNMRLSPIHSTSAAIPGQGRVCFLALQSGEGAEGEVDFAFYAGAEPLAIMRGPGIPVTVRGLSMQDLNGDGAPEVLAVLQRADGGYENRVYWSEKKGDGFVWVEDAAVNRHVSGESAVGGIVAIITGEKISAVDGGSGDAAAPAPPPEPPSEPALTPEPVRPRSAAPSAPIGAQDAQVGDVLDMSGRFVRTGQGLRFIPYGRPLDADYVVETLPPGDEARLGELTGRDSRIAAEVMQLETAEGKRIVRIQVLQIQPL